MEPQACEHNWEDISAIENGHPGYTDVRCRRCDITTTIPRPGHLWQEARINDNTFLHFFDIAIAADSKKRFRDSVP